MKPLLRRTGWAVIDTNKQHLIAEYVAKVEFHVHTDEK